MKVWRIFYKNHLLLESTEFHTRKVMEREMPMLERWVKKLGEDFDPQHLRRREYNIPLNRKNIVQVYRRKGKLYIKTGRGVKGENLP